MTKNAKETSLLSLLEVSRRTGISYPTLQKYVELHGKLIPSQGSGSACRYPPEAIGVFKKLHAE